MSELVYKTYASVYTPASVWALLLSSTQKESKKQSNYFNDKRLQMVLVNHAIRDYDSDLYSKDIINKCIEYGPDCDFI